MAQLSVRLSKLQQQININKLASAKRASGIGSNPVSSAETAAIQGSLAALKGELLSLAAHEAEVQVLLQRLNALEAAMSSSRTTGEQPGNMNAGILQLLCGSQHLPNRILLYLRPVSLLYV